MARNAVGIDIGTDAVRVVTGVDRKGVFVVTDLVTAPFPRKDLDAAGRGAVLAQAVGSVKGEVYCGLTGRDVVLRYTQVPPVPDWQLRQLMEFEIQEMTGQSGGDELSADFNLVPVVSDLTSDDIVLLALAKQAILDHHLEVLGAAAVTPRAFTPNSVALFNAFRKTDDGTGTTLLVNIGARHTDMVLARDGELFFARNLSGGGELFDDALVASFNVSAEKARKLKHEMADVSPFDSAPRRSNQEEKVARALSGATGQVFSMVQSSVMFAKSQTGVQDLSLDRVLLCGGGSLVRGLDRYLASNLNVPVERFDPFEHVDVTAVEAELDEDERAGAVVALGLAMQAAYDDCYSIEILPPAMKKSRDFNEKTLFAVLAAVLVVAFLGFDAWRSRADYEAATKDSRAFESELKKRQRSVEAFAEAVVARAENARKLELLEEHVVAGVGLERALGMVQRYLPPDLYVKGVELVRTKDEELGVSGDSKPAIEVRGEGREGIEGLEQLFNRFVTDLARDPLLPRTPKTKTSPSGPKKAFEWTVTMNFSQLAVDPNAAADGDEEDADGSE